MPAVVYSIQNVAIQVGYQHTSGMLFNLLNQTKTIFTAVMIYVLIGTRPSPRQARCRNRRGCALHMVMPR